MKKLFYKLSIFNFSNNYIHNNNNSNEEKNVVRETWILSAINHKTSTITCSYSANTEHNVSQVLRFFIFLCHKKKKRKKENRVTGIVVHAHHPRIAIFHEEGEGRGRGRGEEISGPSNWFFDSREGTAILDAIAETLHRNEPIEPRHRR